MGYESKSLYDAQKQNILQQMQLKMPQSSVMLQQMFDISYRNQMIDF